MNVLTAHSTYRSVSRPISWIARHHPTAVFYAKIVHVVWQAARFAKRGIYNGERWIQSSLNTVKALEDVGGRFDLQNIKVHAQIDTACVFVGNHMSILETFVLPCLIRPYRKVTFVVKESLLNYPLFGPVLQSRLPLVVGRVNPREDLKAVLEGGRRHLDEGRSVIIFPQTTRSTSFDPNSFNTLGIKLAKRGKVPIVPFALKTDAWGLGHKIKDFGKISPDKTVHIAFGEPVMISGAGKIEHQRVIDFITQHLNTWQQDDFS